MRGGSRVREIERVRVSERSRVREIERVRVSERRRKGEGVGGR